METIQSTTGQIRILLLIAALLATYIPQHWINHVYKKYSKVRSRSGATGAVVANRILIYNGYSDVRIGKVSGTLSDHYNPQKETVNLSLGVYDTPSVAAAAIAAHECGHVCQKKESWGIFRLRQALAPAAGFASNFGIYAVLLGCLFEVFRPLLQIGIILYAFGLLFQLITLPVEFNASGRGLAMLQEYNILTETEMPAARKVLRAAALTYVAAALASTFTLVRLILRNK